MSIKFESTQTMKYAKTSTESSAKKATKKTTTATKDAAPVVNQEILALRASLDKIYFTLPLSPMAISAKETKESASKRMSGRVWSEVLSEGHSDRELYLLKLFTLLAKKKNNLFLVPENFDKCTEVLGLNTTIRLSVAILV